MFETFSLRLAAGMTAALLVLPRGTVAARFYRIHLIVVLCLQAAAGVFAWETVLPDTFWLTLGVAGGAALLGCWSYAFREVSPAQLPALGLTVAATLAALALLPGPTGAAWWLARLDDATAAALLGAAMTAMLLGHWYLIAPNLSITPLLRLHYALFASLAVRCLVVGFTLVAAYINRAGFDGVTWLWLAPRVGAGLAGAAVLATMAWAAARIRSTQSATGILYVVVVFVLLGELTDQLLHQHWGGAA